MNGLSVQKIFFQPDVNLDLAIAQIVSATNAIRALMPPGIQPPIVVQFNASSVPVLQISLTSDSLNEQQLYDYGIYRMRQQLAPIPGITLPTPAGGKYRQIMVDIDPTKLVANGLTPLDIVNVVNAQNLTLPSGTAKIADKQYTVRTNATPPTIDDLNNIPVKVTNGATVFLKDVGQVHDGWLVQQNVVREDGKRSVLLSVIKNGNASTLQVVNAVRDALKTARAAAPAGMEIKELFDQSVFVKDSITGVLREGAIAAGLTALMILLFLGSWRSTVVVMISIPLAILTSLVALYFLGETLNTMTLGGLALADRHPGRRFDGDDRKHPPPAHRRTIAAAAGNAARCRRHRRADIGVDARHQLRLHVGGVPRRAGKVPVHPAGARCRVRDAGIIRTVENADADHHRAAAQGRASRPGGRCISATGSAAFIAPSSAASNSCARAMLGCSPRCSSIALSSRSSLCSCSCSGPRCLSWWAAISFRPSTAVRSSSTSAHPPEPELRARSASSRRWKTRSARSSRRASVELHRRQYRAAGARVQPGIHRRFDHRRQ